MTHPPYTRRISLHRVLNLYSLVHIIHNTCIIYLRVIEPWKILQILWKILIPSPYIPEKIPLLTNIRNKCVIKKIQGRWRHVLHFLAYQKEKMETKKKRKSFKASTIKRLSQGHDVTAFAILERLEFKSFPCQPQFFSVLYGSSTLKSIFPALK